MPSLDDYQDSLLVKILYLGDSGTGKTSSLLSLLAAGYKLKIIDFDKGVLNLIMHIRKAGLKLSEDQFEYFTFQDQYKATQQGLILSGPPKAFTDMLKKLTEWSAIDDPMTVVVIDSLTMMGRAAFAWANGMNPSNKDKRAIYGLGQDAIEDTISVLTSDNFKTNVIVITHIKYDEMEGLNKGFPNALGKALGPKLPRYFNIMIQAETQGSGNNVRRKIRTLPTGLVDLKLPPIDIASELPLDTGLATIFNKLKEQTNA